MGCLWRGCGCLSRRVWGCLRPGYSRRGCSRLGCGCSQQACCCSWLGCGCSRQGWGCLLGGYGCSLQGCSCNWQQIHSHLAAELSYQTSQLASLAGQGQVVRQGKGREESPPLTSSPPSFSCTSPSFSCTSPSFSCTSPFFSRFLASSFSSHCEQVPQWTNWGIFYLTPVAGTGLQPQTSQDTPMEVQQLGGVSNVGAIHRRGGKSG